MDPEDPSVIRDGVHDPAADDGALLADFHAGAAERASVIDASMFRVSGLAHVSTPAPKVCPRRSFLEGIVPVPQGERSSRPGETTTALTERKVSGPLGDVLAAGSTPSGLKSGTSCCSRPRNPAIALERA